VVQLARVFEVMVGEANRATAGLPPTASSAELVARDTQPSLQQLWQVSCLGDAESSLGDAKSSLGDAESSLGDAKCSLGDAKSSLGDTLRARWETLRARWMTR
jgi:hypothetical protein